MVTSKELGRRINERRKEIGLTLQEVADKVHVENSTISRYERGEIISPKLPVVESIANALCVTPGYLLDKPDLYLSPDQQGEMWSVFSSASQKSNLSIPFAIVQLKIEHDFSSKLQAKSLGNARMYDILAVAKYMGVYEDISNIIELQSPTDEQRSELDIQIMELVSWLSEDQKQDIITKLKELTESK